MSTIAPNHKSTPRKVRFYASHGLFKLHEYRKYDGSDTSIMRDKRAHYVSADYGSSTGYEHTYWTTEEEFAELQKEYGVNNVHRLSGK